MKYVWNTANVGGNHTTISLHHIDFCNIFFDDLGEIKVQISNCYGHSHILSCCYKLRLVGIYPATTRSISPGHIVFGTGSSPPSCHMIRNFHNCIHKCTWKFASTNLLWSNINWLVVIMELKYHQLCFVIRSPWGRTQMCLL